MEIRRVHRTTISDQICEQMKQMILDRTWKPGQKVPSEGELAEQFGVSRASIREALLKLNAVGLLESRFSGGHYVREAGADICMNAILPIVYVSNNSVMEVLEFRQVVEARIAGLAARRAGTEDVKLTSNSQLKMTTVATVTDVYTTMDSAWPIFMAKVRAAKNMPLRSSPVSSALNSDTSATQACGRMPRIAIGMPAHPAMMMPQMRP